MKYLDFQIMLVPFLVHSAIVDASVCMSVCVWAQAYNKRIVLYLSPVCCCFQGLI